jgi:PAS domain S-box-containing protein
MDENTINTRSTKRRRPSITSKLTMLLALSSSIALLLSCLGFVANDISLLRKNKVNELTSVAQVLASNSTAALAFMQPLPAEELLSSLHQRHNVECAYLFDADGNVFAHVKKSDSSAHEPVWPVKTGYSFSEAGFLTVAVPVMEDDERLGMVVLRATVDELQGQIVHYVGIAASVSLASLLVTVLIGSRLQRFISDPLVTLAQTIHRVKEDGDYSIRVDKPSDDEIGELYDEFNALLSRVEFADRALHRAHEELRDINTGLEERVRERTEALSQANVELEYNETRVRAVVESANDGIFTIDDKLVIQSVNLAAENIFGYQADELIGKSVNTLTANTNGVQSDAILAEYIGAEDRKLLGKRREVEGVRSDGTRFPMELTMCEAAFRDQIIFTGFVRDLTTIKEAEQQLIQMNDQLLEASRLAGRAEVANNVLHNVGNVLNSVNVAAALLSETVRNSEVTDLNRVLELVDQHQDDLGQFLANDPRGKHLPGYLVEAGQTLGREQAAVLDKLESLTKNIDHIKNIVSTQQSYAGISGVEQVVELAELLDDALNINVGSAERGCVDVKKEYDDLAPISLDKQKVMQILINLIGNAKHAIRDSTTNDGKILLRISHEEDWAKLRVTDNGIGITAENLEKIFRHGFTTKSDGHGFGLHSAVLAAKEMGGSLVATSDGPNLGATFTLTLPMKVQAKVSA